MSHEQLSLMTPDQLAEHEYRPEDQRGDLLNAYHTLLADITEPNHSFGENDIFNYHWLLAHSSPQMEGARPNEYRDDFRGIDNMPWVVKPFPHPGDVPIIMKRLGGTFGEYMDFQITSPDNCIEVIEHAAEIKIDLTDAHPFKDGNGRLGRLLADGMLLKGGLYQMPHWLDQKHKGNEVKQKLTYFLQIESARVGYPALLLKFMTEQQLLALRNEVSAIQSNSVAFLEAIETGHLDLRLAIIRSLNEYDGILGAAIASTPMPKLEKNPNFTSLLENAMRRNS